MDRHGPGSDIDLCLEGPLSCKPMCSGWAGAFGQPLEELESLAEALLDFRGPEELTTWLAANA